jgi:sugar/nucleoside kinase (ribokinase family)
MKNSAPVSPVDYLVISHLCVDRTAHGPQLGGTAAYAALMAAALGRRVGIVTAWGGEISLAPLRDRGVEIVAVATRRSTCFENIRTNNERAQILHHIGPRLDFSQIPAQWRSSPIVHLGPIAQELSPYLVERFPTSAVYLTAQGWLRAWDRYRNVRPAPWTDAIDVLRNADAAVISNEDVANDENHIRAMADSSEILVITEGARGARVSWQGGPGARYRPPTSKKSTPQARAISLRPRSSSNFRNRETRGRRQHLPTT